MAVSISRDGPDILVAGGRDLCSFVKQEEDGLSAGPIDGETAGGMRC